MFYLRQSTASQSVQLGPFLDSTDGNTPATGLTIANTDIKLSKNGASQGSKNSGGATHDAGGWYGATFDATDTNTVGRLQVSVHVSGALAVWMDCTVLEEAVYDILYASSATGAVPVSAGGITSSSFAAGAIDATAIADNAIDAGAIATGAITAAKFAADAITSTVIADNAITANKLATAAITAAKFAADAITSTVVADSTITANKIASNAITSAKIAADAIGATQIAADAITEIQSGLATSAALSSVASQVTGVPAAILAADVDTDLTVQDQMRLAAAALYGISSSSAGERVYRDTNDTKDRITAVVTDAGNRTAVTLDPS